VSGPCRLWAPDASGPFSKKKEAPFPVPPRGGCYSRSSKDRTGDHPLTSREKGKGKKKGEFILSRTGEKNFVRGRGVLSGPRTVLRSPKGGSSIERKPVGRGRMEGKSMPYRKGKRKNLMRGGYRRNTGKGKFVISGGGGEESRLKKKPGRKKAKTKGGFIYGVLEGNR